MSISVEMSRHLRFLRVVHHLVEMTLEPLFQTVLGLTDILFLASSAGDAVDQVVAVARHVVSSPIFSTCDTSHYLAICVQQGTISAFPVRASLVGLFVRLTLLRDGGEFRLNQ